MKTLLLIALTLVLYSCTKCEQCTRIWTVYTYDSYPDGTIMNATQEEVSKEIFQACSRSEIKQAELPQITENTLNMSGYIKVSRYTGECDCK